MATYASCAAGAAAASRAQPARNLGALSRCRWGVGVQRGAATSILAKVLAQEPRPDTDFGKVSPGKDIPERAMVVNALRKDNLVRGAPVGRLDDEGKGVVELYVRKDKMLYEFTYSRALPGERLHLRVDSAVHDRFKGRKRPGKYRLELEDRGASSPNEVTPACDHFSLERCGGCAIQHLDYEAQLQEKMAWLGLQMGYYKLRRAEVEEIVPSPSVYGFLGRTEFSFFLRDGPRLGLRPAGSPVPVDIRRCHLHPLASHRAFEAVLEAVRNEPDSSPFDERTGNGWLCSAMFRAAVWRTSGQHEVLVTLVTLPQAPEEPLRRIAAAVVESCKDVVGVAWSREGGEPAVRTGGWRSQGILEQPVLAGRGYLLHEIGGLAFQGSPEAFLRPNLLLLDSVLRCVEDFCGGIGDRGGVRGEEGEGDDGDVLWDTFCGQGVLSFFLLAQRRFRRVVALDRAAPALQTMSRNLDAHGFSSQVDVICADLGVPAEIHRLAGRLPHLAKQEPADPHYQSSRLRRVNDAQEEGEFLLPPLPRPEVLLCDPGRNGMPKAFRRFLADLQAPLAIYVGSGRPFLRDCVLLQRRGYELEVVVPFDSHPHTARFEMVAKLRWRGLRSSKDDFSGSSLNEEGEWS